MRIVLIVLIVMLLSVAGCMSPGGVVAEEDAPSTERTWRLGQKEIGQIAFCKSYEAAEEVVKAEAVDGLTGAVLMLLLHGQQGSCGSLYIEFTPINILGSFTTPISEVKIVAIDIEGTVWYLLTRRRIVEATQI